MWWAARILILAAAVSTAAWSQPRGVEVWGNTGAARVGGDEGSLGSGAIYGAGVSLPFTRSLALEVDAQRVRAERFTPLTRIMISPALVWRFGNQRVYGFAGGGAGIQIDRIAAAEPYTDDDITLHVRGGVVVTPIGRLIVRAEVFSVWHFLLPTAGVKIGAGYRF
ncbi:MAG: hypothetical protein ACRD7E_05345 [Bryobacteraceae bacterium]